MEKNSLSVHPSGELALALEGQGSDSLNIDTFAGKVRVNWDPDARVTPMGQLGFFIDFLKTANLFEPWQTECPLNYRSPNSPTKRDMLGTLLLSILAGHWRYAHITNIRGDRVNPELLGMRQVMSEDSVRRGLLKIESQEGTRWIQRHLQRTHAQLLTTPWILDVDTTIKPLYGHQEGATLGYNPKKPGRPCHSYHTYLIANLRLVLDVEVLPGNESASSYTSPRLWRLLDGMPQTERPYLLRGDANFGNELLMKEAEARGIDYLFKLRQTARVKQCIYSLQDSPDWKRLANHWEGIKSELHLTGWSRSRRVVILRHRVKEKLPPVQEQAMVQLSLPTIMPAVELYEYAVLVTSRDDECLTLYQLYRDRGDAENVFDEMKRDWGWSGFSGRDLNRCRLVARIIALIYNWWSIYARLITPDKHHEAITSRPYLLHAVGLLTHHARQCTLSMTSTHARAKTIQVQLTCLAAFFKTLRSAAEQLNPEQRWSRILLRAFGKFLNKKRLRPPDVLLAPG